MSSNASQTTEPARSRAVVRRIVGGNVITWPDRATPVDEDSISRTCAAAVRATSLGLGWNGE